MTAVLAVLVVGALSSLVTAAGVVWLCVRLNARTERFFVDAADRDEAETMRDVTITDALLRIEEAAQDARRDIARVAARVDVATELGFQAAEGQHRMEDADAVVAGDLAGSIARADALPKDGNFGAAADAALRSAEDRPSDESEA